jgi:hypothetical protein
MRLVRLGQRVQEHQKLPQEVGELEAVVRSLSLCLSD